MSTYCAGCHHFHSEPQCPLCGDEFAHQTSVPLAMRSAIAALVAELQQADERAGRLQQRLNDAHRDASYGCLTRAGLDERYSWHQRRDTAALGFIFFDLDGMHDLNTELGYAAVDARIRAALAHSTRDGECAAGRWYSGDELVVLLEIVPGDTGVAETVALRIADELEAVGLSATFAFGSLHGRSSWVDRPLAAIIERLSLIVQAAKVNGQRGSIQWVGL